ncbi:hypothetical protein [Sinorhizobium medicae]|uniref:hypothetical protein n=1 Tax=Sinorhizobium medicae TaxID=110321 RepID=UPI000C7AE3AD|nr:hypothetical protein [Sinorhizobium medicae]MDX0426879.1 hypothetical protein [Sinorhizobium medicae]PLU02353.1 hypothetical protein BMJ32_13090 [Sinorhizobium medicae]PLU64509.1 hypothetical protein BMJ21_22835 [Sinorhizobium medicae]TWA22726.1 hypothetical protein FB006_10916 [Sinorhizobium medicae]TWA43024.1 hypothetical protein FB005_10916 [Sinorhizobium medicae]
MMGILAFLIKIGLSGVVERGIKLMERRAELEVDKEKLRTELTAEYMREVVEETRIMAGLNKAKMQVPCFWMFAALFVLPLGFWWAAVILDGTFHFGWNVANLPTPEMRQWAGDMIKWIFYVGGGVAGVKAVLKR